MVGLLATERDVGSMLGTSKLAPYCLRQARLGAKQRVRGAGSCYQSWSVEDLEQNNIRQLCYTAVHLL